MCRGVVADALYLAQELQIPTIFISYYNRNGNYNLVAVQILFDIQINPRNNPRPNRRMLKAIVKSVLVGKKVPSWAPPGRGWREADYGRPDI